MQSIASLKIRTRQSVGIAALLACAMTAGTVASLTGPARAAEAGAIMAQATQQFDIPALPLSEALIRFGRQSGRQVTADIALTEGRSSAPVDGAMTWEEALVRLLGDTGLTYRRNGEIIAIEERRSETETGETILTPIAIEALAENAYGPVDGYHATRSGTGTKTDAAIIDIPASVHVVPREVIEDQQATRLADALRNVSGVQTFDTGGNRSDKFLVRGLPSSRLARDGFLSASTFGEVGFIDMANVERVEVLKGPASVLYGAVDPGGLINIVTKQPQPDTFYSGGLTLGSFDFRRAEADVNTRISEDGRFLARISSSYQDAGSFRDLFVDAERFHVAPSFKWAPNESTTLDVQTEYYEQEQQFDRGLFAVNGDALALPIETYLGEADDIADANEFRAQATLKHQFADHWAASVKFRISDATASPIDTNTSANGLQADGRTVTRTRIGLEQEFQTRALDANISGKVMTGPLEHDVLVGTDLHLTEFTSAGFGQTAPSIDIFTLVQTGAFGNRVALASQERNVDIYGLYAQDLISIGEDWKVLLGGRFDRARTEFLRNGVANTIKRENAFSPRAGIVYKPMEDLSLYASYAESFIPTLSGQTADGSDFEPEEGEQFEIGVKREWFGSRLSTTASIFEVTRKNVSTSDPANPGFSIQVGEQRSRGAEFEAAGDLGDGWQIIGALTYLDSVVTKDNTFGEGNRLTNVPEVSGSLWGTYSFQNPSLKGLEIGAGVFAVGEREGDLNNRFTVPGYARVDMLVRYRITDNVTAALNVHNLFDTEYVEAVADAARIEPGIPLAAYANVKVKF